MTPCVVLAIGAPHDRKLGIPGEDLPGVVDPCGENGEFHTCVSDGPMFAAPLELRQGETVLRDARFAYTDLLLA